MKKEEEEEEEELPVLMRGQMLLSCRYGASLKERVGKKEVVEAMAALFFYLAYLYMHVYT